tara:strand:- start:1692 stop:8606 length:6915 start_codon:yes stop_codon:yes gene_type:complete
MANLDQNVSPYYDDFDDTKNYKRILFRPSFAVQARELTQLQTNLSEQIKDISTPIFENGEALIPGELRYSTTVPVLTLKSDSGSYLQNSYSITDTTSAKYLIGKYIMGATSKAIAKVIAGTAATQTSPVKLYLFVLSGTFSSSSEVLNIYNQTEAGTGNTGDKVADSATSSAYANDGIMVSIKSGNFYINGYSVYTPDQMLVLDSNYSRRIGFNVTESFVTEASDSTLLDNSSGSTNYQAPGADRYKIALTLASKESIVTGSVTSLVTADENFIELAKFDSKGNFIDLTNNYGDNLVQQQDIDDVIYQDNGNYIEQTPIITLKDDTNTSVNLNIGGGKAYIDGKEVNFDETDISLSKPSTFIDLDSSDSVKPWPGIDLAFSQSNSVVTNGGITWDEDIANSKWMELGDTANAVNIKLRKKIGSTNEDVATAKIRNIESLDGITVVQLEAEGTAGSSPTHSAEAGVTANTKSFTEGEMIYGSDGSGEKKAYGKLLYIEQKVTGGASAVESTLLYIQLYSGYFDSNDVVYGITSDVQASVGQTAGNYLFYEQFDSKQEYKFYLYDIEFKTNTITNLQYSLKDASIITDNSGNEIANLETNYTADDDTDYGFNVNANNLANTAWPKQYQENTTDYGDDETLTTYSKTGSDILVSPSSKQGVRTLSNITVDRVRVGKSATATSTTEISVAPPPGHTIAVDSSNHPLDGYGDVIVYGEETVSEQTTRKVFRKAQLDLTFTSSSITISPRANSQVIPVQGTTASDEYSADSNITFTNSGTYQVIFTAKRTTESTAPVVKTLETASLATTNHADTVGLSSSDQVPIVSYTLGHADVLPTNFKVYQMKDFNTTASKVNALATNGGVDITERYEIDTGQRDLCYDLGSLKLKRHYKENKVYPTGNLWVVYYYFSWGNQQTYISIDSYFSTDGLYTSGIDVGANSNLPDGVDFESLRKDANGNPTLNKYFPEDIPIYTSNTTNFKVDLIDSIDFRSRLSSAGVDKLIFHPSAGEVTIGKISYREPKTISVFLDSSGEFITTSSSSRALPKDIDRLLPICTVFLPGNLFSKDEIIVKPIETNKKKALDIGKIEKLLEDVDGKVLSNNSSLELELGRIKGEVFTDTFEGHNKADVSNPEYDAAIDLRRNELRPGYKQENLPFGSAHTSNNSHWITPIGADGNPTDDDTLIPSGILTSGSLSSGTVYKILKYKSGDDFSGVGGVNQQGAVFTATGTTPSWDQTSELIALPTKGHALLGRTVLSTNGLVAGFYNQQSTEDMEIKSSDLTSYYGTMQLTPSLSLFKSIKSPVDVVSDKKGIYNSLKENKKVETVWEDWKTNWFGDNMRQIDSDSDIKSLLSTYDSNSNTKSFNDKKINLDYVPYMKSETISGSVHGLKPSGDDLTFTFDGVDYTQAVVGEMSNVTSAYSSSTHAYIKNDLSGNYKLKADKTGKMAFTFTPPNEDEGVVYIKTTGTDSTGDPFSANERIFQLYQTETSANVEAGGVRTVQYNIVSGTVIWHDTNSHVIALKEVDGEFTVSSSAVLSSYATAADGIIRNEDNSKSRKFVSYYGKKKHKVGPKKLKLDGSGTASAIFHATGLPDNTLSTRNFEIAEKNQLDNSIVQIIKPNVDMTLDKVDLYFSAKDDIADGPSTGTKTVDNRPVILQIRTVNKGKATNEVLPFTTVIKHDISDITGNSPTTFSFDEYIPLFKGVQYAITIISVGGYKLRVLDTNLNAGTKPAGFGSMWRGNKRLPTKALKMMLYTSFHSFGENTSYFKTSTLPSIELDKDSIITKANNSYLKIHLPGHGFKIGDKMKISGIEGRTETRILLQAGTNVTSSNVVKGDFIFLTGSGDQLITDNISNSYMSYTKQHGRVIQLVDDGSGSSTATVDVAVLGGTFAASDSIEFTTGGTGTVATSDGALNTTSKYFGGKLVTEITGDNDWKVDSTNPPTKDYFYLTKVTSDGNNFQRDGVIIDEGKVKLIPTDSEGPSKNANLIHYSGRFLSTKLSKDTFKHRNSSIPSPYPAATLNYDTFVDYNLQIKDNLELYWTDNRSVNERFDFSFVDRQTLSATVINNLISSNYITKKNVLKTPANSIRVILDANLPKGTGLKVYIKSAAVNSGINFDDLSWQEVLPDSRIINDNNDNFSTYQFTKDRLNDYGLYQIKVEMTTSDPTNVVRIKNLQVVPNRKDNSLKPLQVATVSIKTFVSNTHSSEGASNHITIPSDFVVEDAVVIVEAAQDNNATNASYWDRSIVIDAAIRRYNDGSIFPAYSAHQTGCIAMFWKGTDEESGQIADGGGTPTTSQGFNVRAKILMFGRKP